MKTQFTKLLTLSLCLLCFSISSYGQGIKWTEGLSWEQIKTKAKAENKYIFVDCYATWCGPCKTMDKDVYPLDIVGQAINDKFISVKVQMDSIKSDPINIKQLYQTARTFERDYKITGLPSYLFFSPDGFALHKSMGAKTASEFIQLVKDSLDPYKQLFTQARSMCEGKMDVNLIPTFIQRIKDNGDEEIALELARLFMKKFLEKLPETEFLSERNLQFMNTYRKMLTTKDKFFELCDKQDRRIDSLLKRPGYANGRINYLLGKEYVQPVVDAAKKKGIEPDWNYVIKNLKTQTTDLRADNIVFSFKSNWYYGKKDWENYTKYLFKQVNALSTKEMENLDALRLNGFAWDFFQYSFDLKALELGLVCMEKAIDLWGEKEGIAGLLDTKANLLYKLARKEEALSLQIKAVSLAPTNPDLIAALAKMKSGNPTWEIGVKEKRKVK